MALKEIESLWQENERLVAEVERLRGLLKSHGIPYEPKPEPPRHVDSAAEAKRRVNLFMKLFAPEEIFMQSVGRAKAAELAIVPFAAIAGHPCAQRRHGESNAMNAINKPGFLLLRVWHTSIW